MPGGAQLLFAERVENIEPATHVIHSVRCLRTNVEWRWTMIEQVERVGHFNINSDRFEPALSCLQRRIILIILNHFHFGRPKLHLNIF